MADTGLPRSEAARPPAADRRAALARFLAAASGAERCTITALVPLTGGAIQENWGVDAVFAGGMLAGEQRLVLRAAGDTGVPSSLDRMQEFAVLKAAFAAGVTVPEPLFAAADPAIFGKPFFVMRRAAGYAAAHRITRDPALEPALPAIAEELGRQLARIHRIRPPRPDLGFLSPPDTAGPEHHIAAFRRYLDQYAAPRPVRCCATAISAPATTWSTGHNSPVFSIGNLPGGATRMRTSAGSVAATGGLRGSTAKPAGSPRADRSIAATRARADAPSTPTASGSGRRLRACAGRSSPCSNATATGCTANEASIWP